MNRILIPVFLIAGLFIVACSDDDKPVPTTDSAIADKAITTETAPTAGACTNAADFALLDSATKQDGVKGKATACGLKCISDADPGKCATTCVVKDTGLSSACSACYVGIIMCSMTNCLADCATDPSSKACTDCMTKNNCYTKFYTCTGLTPPATSDAGL